MKKTKEGCGMERYKSECGFILKEASVAFEFESEAIPKSEGELFVIEGKGALPVPKLKKSDRLILPVDEGIAIEVGKAYEKGELDIDRIGGPFLSREGTASLVLVERERHFLLIALQSGIGAGYLAERRGGMYALTLYTTRRTCVAYSICDSLAEAVRIYKDYKGIAPLTLREKVKKLPNIEASAGGIFWIWNDAYDEVMYAKYDTERSACVGDALLSVAADLSASGVDRAMFGIFFDEDSRYVKPLWERYGYIATQYDNYNDVLNPSCLPLIPKNRVKSCGYTRRRMKDYPSGVSVTEDGGLAPAWALRGYDGRMYPQNTLCPRVAAERMREEIPEIIREYPCYAGRFIDVYGGSVNACYSEVHPVTEEECLQVKKEAFRFLGDIGLVGGTEDGFEELVDTVAYTEGLHSPVYFRIEDAGRNHAKPYTPVQTAHIRRHMVDPASRVPLWQLLYHDAVLSFPYWGDSTASAPSLVREKILFACLFGAPPLYSFTVKNYAVYKAEILESYHKIGGVLKYTAFLPMTDYQVLSEDRMLLRSVFGDRYEVIANFAETEAVYCGKSIAAKDFYFGELV